MTYEPLHHKYRPQTFADLVGQQAITATLTEALRQNRIAPAYLFCGPRGTGKTSSARILAKSLNCLSAPGPTESPCGQCQTCQEITKGASLDVVEIDAASNTGVDNIRELIERAQFAPVQCRHKVYIIDECHMLSGAAFNALLKTLEEPPPHVVFVLATTDPQRVLPTIISRCQKFDYRRIPLADMVAHLTMIAAQESIAIGLDAVTLVAQIAQGGLRDAESLLDQLSLLPAGVSIEAVWDLVGAVPERDLLALVQSIVANDPEALLDCTRRLMDRGREPGIVLQNLASFYRDLLIAKTAPERSDLVALTPPTWAAIVAFVESVPLTWLLHGQQHLKASETQLRNTTQPRLWLEVTLMGLLPGSIAAPTSQPANQPASYTPSPAPPVRSASPGPIASSIATPPVQPPPVAPPISQPIGQNHGPTSSPASRSPDRPAHIAGEILSQWAETFWLDTPADFGDQLAGAIAKVAQSDPEAIVRLIQALQALVPGHRSIVPPNQPAQAYPTQAYPTQTYPTQTYPTQNPQPTGPAVHPASESMVQSVATPEPSIDLAGLWAEVVAQIPTPAVRIKLQQRSQLLKFDGRSAVVGTPNSLLASVTSNKPEIEAAFSQRLGQPIAVTIQAATVSARPAIAPMPSPLPTRPPAIAPASPSPAAVSYPPPPRPVPQPAPQVVPQVAPQAAPPAASIDRAVATEVRPGPAATPSPDRTQPDRETSSAIDAPAPSRPGLDDDLSRSAQRLAEFFNGEVVRDVIDLPTTDVPADVPGTDLPGTNLPATDRPRATQPPADRARPEPMAIDTGEPPF